MKRFEYYEYLIDINHDWNETEKIELGRIREMIEETKWLETKINIFDDTETPEPFLLTSIISGIIDKVKEKKVKKPRRKKEKKVFTDEEKIQILNEIFLTSLKLKKVFLDLPDVSRVDIFETFMALIASVKLVDIFETLSVEDKVIKFLNNQEKIIDTFIRTHKGVKTDKHLLNDPIDFELDLKFYIKTRIKEILTNLEESRKERNIDPDVINLEDTFDTDKIKDYIDVPFPLMNLLSYLRKNSLKNL